MQVALDLDGTIVDMASIVPVSGVRFDLKEMVIDPITVSVDRSVVKKETVPDMLVPD